MTFPWASSCRAGLLAQHRPLALQSKRVPWTLPGHWELWPNWRSHHLQLPSEEGALSMPRLGSSSDVVNAVLEGSGRARVLVEFGNTPGKTTPTWALLCWLVSHTHAHTLPFQMIGFVLLFVQRVHMALALYTLSPWPP